MVSEIWLFIEGSTYHVSTSACIDIEVYIYIYYTPTWTSFEQAWPVVPLFSFIYSTDIRGGSATNSIENWVPFILNTKILEKIFVGILYDNEIIISHHCNSHCFDKFEKKFCFVAKTCSSSKQQITLQWSWSNLKLPF